MLERLKHAGLFCAIGLAARQAVALPGQFLYRAPFLQLSEHFEQGAAVGLTDVKSRRNLFR
jgi:hypothetical protein